MRGAGAGFEPAPGWRDAGAREPDVEAGAGAVHGGRVYEYVRVSGRPLEDIVDFSANINPLGPPATVREAILRAMDGIRHYPDPEQREVRRVLAEAFQLPGPEWVFCGNGAAEVMDLVLRTARPRRVFVFDPAFAEYEAASRRCGARVVRLPLSAADAVIRAEGGGGAALGVDGLGNTGGMAPGWRAEEPDGAVPEWPRDGDVVVFNNPHNPTGRIWTREQVERLVRPFVAAGAMVMVDESFLDFRWDERDWTAIPLALADPRVVVVRSATKMYSIPGLRFGFGVANPGWVRRVERDRDGWSVNHLAQAAAAAAYRDEAFRTATWRWLRAEQAFVRETWGQAPGVRLHPPGVNFFLIEWLDGLDVEGLVASWAADGMFVRRCHTFRGLSQRHVRVAIRTPQENRRLWAAFVRWREEHG
ncbi:aminotransferase class I/II-fold pyridoxal phosphate-dependent enzyme [Alicyclobacillus sp.]|uniref:pyridoxal phosphate-dependent aminotransferase n=1 Tax=Alicyclobacillus sp. TaxID=61169 RepID=UPI0025C2E102|nr:aminotransferase class I/II-fold pyridoxal phosphate-dependent enzyme [Alicyclobacillus sp.]MCL6518021.1 aminotransferase class I/II-fold pyridoxal phosphate-dependent enzyme [Alicyclobacillus sp.]